MSAPRSRGVAAAAVVVSAAYLLLFGETLALLLRDWWTSGEYGHGLLFLPLALWLAWKARLPAEEWRPARVGGTLALAGAVGLFLVGTVAAEFFTRRAAALGALAGLALYYAGWRQLRAWWLPFAMLAFTIPLPEVVLNSITLPLQLLASEVAVGLLAFRHVPAELSGNIILLPGQELFVAEACSGLRSVSALLGLTLLIGGTGLDRPAGRVLLLAVAVPAALAANALRVFVTGYAAYFWGPGAAEGATHGIVGIAVFGVAMGLVGAVLVVLRRWESGSGKRPPDPRFRVAVEAGGA